MAADSLSFPISPVTVPAPMAWPARGRVQSFPGMAATTAMDRPKSAQERAEARAPEMELIREAQAGSRAAFDALVRQYEHQVLRLALHLTGSEHDAEDIYQDAFLKAFRYIGNFRFECSFYTWIYRIVTNLCLDQLRRRKTRREDHAVVMDHSGDEIDLLASVSDDRRFQTRPRNWTARYWDRGFNWRWASLRPASAWFLNSNTIRDSDCAPSGRC